MSGAPTATTVFLSLDADINYSDGTSDTLPANTLAALPDATTVFDRTHDVYVCYTVQGSRVLSVIKESLLPTLTSAYAPLCRIEMHGIKPYQPEPSLAAGGGGAPGGSTFVVASTVGAERVFILGSTPSLWYTNAYDDSAWALSQAQTSFTWTGLSGAQWVSAAPGALPTTDTTTWLARRSAVLPAGTIASAVLVANGDQSLDDIYVNGTRVGGVTLDRQTLAPFPNVPPLSVVIAPALLVPGANNVLAFLVENLGSYTPNPTSLIYTLTVTYAGAGTLLPAPGSPAEGDLLYYHSGQWISLPVGSSGQELTVVSGDPAWATPAAGYTDPLSTKGDLLTRSGSATVRLGVGSNGQVVTADSTAADGIKWATPSAGSVTSIDVAVPSPLSTSGGPVTASGTITLAWSSGQTANRVLASPDGSSGAVSLRALVGNDIPVDASTIISSAGTIKGNYQAGSGITISGNTISASGGGGSGTVTSVALSLPGIFSVSGSPVTTSGTLSATLANENAATVLAGPATGSAAAPTFRALAGSDLPPAAGAGGHIHAHGHFL